MKRGFVLVWLVMMTFAACQQKEDEVIDDVHILKERFDGRYKIISSYSHEAIDVNQDGVESTDMLVEYPLLSESLIIITINDKNSHTSEPSFILAHHWPNQEFYPEEPVNNVHDYPIDYAMKVVYWYFEFDQSISRIILKPENDNVDETGIFAPPNLIKVDENDRIETIHSKRLYSSTGWKEVKISSIYERYNM